MRLLSIFLLIFLASGSSVLTSGEPTQTIVLDSNFCYELRILFDRLIDQHHAKRPDEKALSYEAIWQSFEQGKSVRDVFKEHLSEQLMKKSEKGLVATDRILDLKRSGLPIEFDIPVYVFNEVAAGKSSKINTLQSDYVKDIVSDMLFTVSYMDFFNSIPIKTNFEIKMLVEGHNFPAKPEKLEPPAKFQPLPENELEKRMKEFLEQKQLNTNGGVLNKNLDKLMKHLSQTPDTDKIKMQERIDRMKKVNADLHDKFELWDTKMKNVLAHNFPDYNTDTMILHAINGKIREYPPIKNFDFKQPVNELAKRLVQSKEEFDFFDLQIYLYAKEKNAPIFTFNAQAFQEVNNPCFLEYFKDTKILHPELNFKQANDLRRSADCIKIIETAIQDDFSNDKRRLTDTNVIKKSNNDELEISKFHEKIGATIDRIKSKYGLQQFGKLETLISEDPLPEALNILKPAGEKVTISKQLTFSTSDYKIVEQKVKALRFIDREFLDLKLSASDFVNDPQAPPSKKQKKNFPAEPELGRLLQEGIENDNANLDSLVKSFRDLSLNSDAITISRALYVENSFNKQEIQNQIKKMNTKTSKISPADCPPGGSRRRKREVGKCLLSWDDIDEINEEHVRDPKKIKIDSEKFMKYVNKIEDPELRKQLIQFAEQIIDPVHGNSGKITGNSEPEMNRLINRNKLFDHFSRLGQVSGALNSGLFAKNIFADLMNGNIEGVAVNVGFLAGDQFLFKLAKMSELKGATFIASGKTVLGNGFKAASPFVKRLGSALVVYDLVEQVKALGKGDKDAVIRIAGDSIILGADAVEIGIGILETAGVVAGVSGVLAPITLTIGAAVFIGTEVYFAVKHVESLDKVLHLSIEEKIGEGLNSIFLSPSSYLEELKEIKSANNMLATEAVKFLAEQESIQSFIFPSAFLNPKTNKIQLSESVRIQTDSVSNIRWDRTRPDDPNGGKVFCAPQGDDESERPPSDTTHRCENAIGIISLSKKEHTHVLFNLSDTFGYVDGFADRTNIFLIGNGFKNMSGGDKDDIFSLRCDADKTRAVIDGLAGDNTLDVSGVTMSGPIRANFWTGSFDSPFLSEFKNVQKFLGRKQLKDIVLPACDTKFISGQGGLKYRSDEILIQPTLKCRYNLTMQLSTFSVVRNTALLGDFTYIIDQTQTDISVLAEFPRNFEHFNADGVKKLLNTSHTIIINHALDDMKGIEVVDAIKENFYKIMFAFQDKKTGKQIPLFFNLNTMNVVVILKDNTEIKVHNYGLFVIHKTDKTTSEALAVYAPIAAQFKMTIVAFSPLSNQTVIAAGDDQHNILSNDPDHETFIAAAGSNTSSVFTINYNPEKSSNLVHISSRNKLTAINTLNLRPVTQQISSNTQNNVIMLYSIDSNTEILDIKLYENASTSLKSIMNVRVANFSDECDNLHIILNNAPVTLKCDHSHRNVEYDLEKIATSFSASDHYTPVPLKFNRTEIIVITVHDIEAHTEIVVQQRIGKYGFLQFENGLVITNTLDKANSSEYIAEPCSILLKNFFQHSEFFYTVAVKFDDVHISLDEMRDSVEYAAVFDDWFEDFNEK